VTLVERGEYFVQIEDWLKDSATRTAPILLWEGPPGSGKSTLLYALVQHARDRGAITLTAACTHADRALPFGVLDQLLRNCRLGPHDAVDPADVLSELDSVQSADAGLTSELTIARVQSALHRFFTVASDAAPVVIAVDDVRHTDELSYRCLTSLLRRLGPSRLLLAVADQSDRFPSAPLITSLTREPSFQRLRLRPLTPTGVARVITEHGLEATEEMVSTLVERTGGNPLLLHALLRPRPDPPDDSTPAYEDALLRCLQTMDEPVLLVARALAFLTAFTDETTAAVDTSAALSAQLLNCGLTSVEHALIALRSAGIVIGHRLRHPRAAAVIIEDTPVDERAQLHVRTARLLNDCGAPPPVVARHVEASGATPDGWAVPVLAEAAENAVRSGRPQAAAQLLELAADAASDADLRAAVTLRLAAVEWQLSPASSAWRLPALVNEARAGQLEPVDVAALVRRLLWTNHVDEAKILTGMLRQTTDPAGAAAFADLLAWLRCWYRGFAQQVMPERVTVAMVNAVPSPETALAHAVLNGHTDESAAAERLLDHPDRLAARHEAEPSLFALLTLLHAGAGERVQRWCERLSAEAASTRNRLLEAVVDAVRAELMIRRGDLTEAVGLASCALTAAPVHAWGAAAGLPLGTLILASTRMGKYDAAAAHLSPALSDAMLDSVCGMHYRYARGEYLLATDRPRAALPEFLACARSAGDSERDSGEFVPWRIGAAQALLRLNDRPGALTLVHDVLRSPGEQDSPTRGGALRLLAATYEVDRRPLLLRDAVEILERHQDHYELARALGDLGRAHHALGERKRARLVINRAVHIAGTCNAEALRRELLPGIEAADTPVGEYAVHPPEITALTPSERRVAAMAVLGYTNREIAARLYVQPGTVEQHLTKVFRKLSVTQRDQLPASLIADDWSKTA
jgi:DNA-binding CsgD family transcriptional regulator/GTPase SAR1 family protein